MLNDFNNITNDINDDIQLSLLSTGLGFKEREAIGNTVIVATNFEKNKSITELNSEKKVKFKEVSTTLKFLSLLSDTLLIFIVSHIEYLLAMKIIFLSFKIEDPIYFIAILLNNIFLYSLLTFRNTTVSENILNFTLNKSNKFIFCFRPFTKSSTYYVV